MGPHSWILLCYALCASRNGPSLLASRASRRVCCGRGDSPAGCSSAAPQNTTLSDDSVRMQTDRSWRTLMGTCARWEWGGDRVYDLSRHDSTASRCAAFTVAALEENSRMTVSKTDKMIAEKDGAIGWITFNNPQRRNAVSMAMWEALGDIVSDYEKDDAIRVIVLKGAGTRRSSPARTSPSSREAFFTGDDQDLQSGVGQGERCVDARGQTDHRHDPRLLHRRRRFGGLVLRPAASPLQARSSACRRRGWAWAMRPRVCAS